MFAVEWLLCSSLAVENWQKFEREDLANVREGLELKDCQLEGGRRFIELCST